jgi:hypothetical protein
MQYRVLRYFKGDDTYILLGHFDLKAQAKMAISNDLSTHPVPDLKYRIDEVDYILSQEEIDLLMKGVKGE